MRLVIRGMSNTEIGEALFLSPHTVDNYRKDVMHRLGARNMVHAVAMLFTRREDGFT